MRILFDTNVILDVLLEREPFVKPALYLMAEVERSRINGLICATTITTIYYLLKKALGSREAIRHSQPPLPYGRGSLREERG